MKGTGPCVNCGSSLGYVSRGGHVPGTIVIVCIACDWPFGEPVPDAPLCSICRRRHGAEKTHAAE